MEQLQKRFHRHMDEANQIGRAIEILRVHPEFEAYEDFKDLMRAMGY